MRWAALLSQMGLQSVQPVCGQLLGFVHLAHLQLSHSQGNEHCSGRAQTKILAHRMLMGSPLSSFIWSFPMAPRMVDISVSHTSGRPAQ